MVKSIWFLAGLTVLCGFSAWCVIAIESLPTQLNMAIHACSFILVVAVVATECRRDAVTVVDQTAPHIVLDDKTTVEDAFE